MAGAYYEKIARINLTTGKIKVEPLDLELAHKFIGGRGLGTKLLYDEGIATVDPLSPENKLIYITGPMTGAAAPSTGRTPVGTPSLWKVKLPTGPTSTLTTIRLSCWMPGNM